MRWPGRPGHTSLGVEARVGAGTVYRNFASKEELVNVLYREAKARLAGFLLEGFPSGASTRQQFAHLWSRMGAYAREHGASLAFAEVHYHAEYLDEESVETSRAVHERFLEVVREGQARRALKPIDPEVIMAAIEGPFFVLVRRARGGALELSEELLQRAEQCVWEAIRA